MLQPSRLGEQVPEAVWWLTSHLRTFLSCRFLAKLLPTMERQASCHCGSLALMCTGEPTKVSQCHCVECQRRTGSLFSVAAFYPKLNVTQVSGDVKVFIRASASGFDVRFHFCPACGSNLWWEADRMPNLIGVAVGAFADQAFPRPDQAVWVSEKHQWLELPSDMPQHERNPIKR